MVEIFFALQSKLNRYRKDLEKVVICSKGFLAFVAFLPSRFVGGLSGVFKIVRNPKKTSPFHKNQRKANTSFFSTYPFSLPFPTLPPTTSPRKWFTGNLPMYHSLLQSDSVGLGEVFLNGRVPRYL